MAQYALPISNQGSTNWTEDTGDADGDWFDEFDEGFGSGRGSGFGPDDDSSGWRAPVGPQNETIRTNLGTGITDPAVSTGHVFRTRNRKNATGGVQIDVISRLYEGASSVRATQTGTDIDDVWTTRGKSLTGGEADGIGDYTDLDIETEADKVGGGQGRWARESAHEFECPDAAAAERVVRNAKLIPKIHHRPRARDARW